MASFLLKITNFLVIDAIVLSMDYEVCAPTQYERSFVSSCRTTVLLAY